MAQQEFKRMVSDESHKLGSIKFLVENKGLRTSFSNLREAKMFS